MHELYIIATKTSIFKKGFHHVHFLFLYITQPGDNTQIGDRKSPIWVIFLIKINHPIELITGPSVKGTQHRDHKYTCRLAILETDFVLKTISKLGFLFYLFLFVKYL